MPISIRKFLCLFITSILLFFSCNNDSSEDSGDTTNTEICNDGVDNDGDGFIDCQDMDCMSCPEIWLQVKN